MRSITHFQSRFAPKRRKSSYRSTELEVRRACLSVKRFGMEVNMKILAIDSSGLVAGVAVAEGDTLLAEYTTNYKKTHSQTLLPMLDEVKRMIELDLSSIDAIAVAAGPGSFTGLRIGSATAKGLGLALDKPLIGVPTVDALAMNLYGAGGYICPIMDARRNQVYTGIYAFVPEKGEADVGMEQTYRLQIVRPQYVAPIEEVADTLNHLPEKKDVIFLGDGVPVFHDRLKELMKRPFICAPASCNRQRAAAVAVLAQRYAQEGRMENARDHAPEYLRPSQAERTRREKAAAAGGQKQNVQEPVSHVDH